MKFTVKKTTGDTPQGVQNVLRSAVGVEGTPRQWPDNTIRHWLGRAKVVELDLTGDDVPSRWKALAKTPA